MKMGMNYKVIIFVLMNVLVKSLTSSMNDSAAVDINGKYLIKMGKLINKPVLSLIGAAITNLHQCGQWSTWSSCTASSPTHFGIKRRTRQCNNGSKSVRTVEELGACKGTCPDDYEVTKNGFCLKLYTLTKTFADAQKHCETDGGNLAKVDTEVKYEDIGKLSGISATGYFFIDGTRKDVQSAWMFATQSNSIFFKWATNEPDNGSTQLCLVIGGSNKLMYDATCLQNRHFICEIGI